MSDILLMNWLLEELQRQFPKYKFRLNNYRDYIGCIDYYLSIRTVDKNFCCIDISYAPSKTLVTISSKVPNYPNISCFNISEPSFPDNLIMFLRDVYMD